MLEGEGLAILNLTSVGEVMCMRLEDFSPLPCYWL